MSTTVSAARTRPVTPIALGAALVAAAGTVYGAHDWPEIVVVTAVIAASTAVVFGVVVRRALSRPSAGGTALALSVPAALLLVPAFWSGLPLVLGVAGAVVGDAGRNSREGSGKSIAGLVLGVLTVLGYLAIYIGDGIVGGNAGFLFD
jgi:hypothetical protein